jgi:hypothetical protein
MTDLLDMDKPAFHTIDMITLIPLDTINPGTIIITLTVISELADS